MYVHKSYKHNTFKLNNLIYTDLFSNIFQMDYENKSKEICKYK